MSAYPPSPIISLLGLLISGPAIARVKGTERLLLGRQTQQMLAHHADSLGYHYLSFEIYSPTGALLGSFKSEPFICLAKISRALQKKTINSLKPAIHFYTRTEQNLIIVFVADAKPPAKYETVSMTI